MSVESERENFWSSHWAAWRSSGLSQRAYCREHGLSYSAFGYWRSRVNGRLSEVMAPTPTFIPVLFETAGNCETLGSVDSSVYSVPIGSGRGAGIEIRLAHGRAIVVDGDFDDALLARVIRVVEQAQC